MLESTKAMFWKKFGSRDSVVKITLAKNFFSCNRHGLRFGNSKGNYGVAYVDCSRSFNHWYVRIKEHRFYIWLFMHKHRPIVVRKWR